MPMPSSDSIVIVSFWLGPQQYGLPIDVVREVVRIPALVALAGAAPALCGLLNLRRYYVPVLDGRILVGETPRYDLTNQIIIVGGAQPKLGLLVDRVDGVATYPASACSPIGRGVAAPLLGSMINSDQGAIILLNEESLASFANIDTLSSAEHAAALLASGS